MRPDFMGFGVAALLLSWTLNYFWPTVGLSALARVADVFWLLLILNCVVVSSGFRRASLRLAPWVVLFWCLLCIAFIGDELADYRLTLYAKTAAYVPIGLFGGMALVHKVRMRERRWIVVVRALAWSLGLWVLGYLGWAMTLGWAPGTTLLTTSLAEHYQGSSRIMGTAAIVAVAAKSQLPPLYTLVVVGACILGVLSFSGMGAAGGIIIAVAWYVWSQDTRHQAVRLLLRMLAGAVALFAGYIAVTRLELFTTYDAFFRRLTRKVVGATAGNEQSRYWLMTRGIEEWLSGGIKNFIVGPGPVSYARAIGYESGYRHPHNLFVAGVVWFGVLSLPLALIMLRTLPLAIRRLISHDAFSQVIALLFAFYFGLAMIGGDLEQNRFFFLLVGAVWYISFSRRPWLRQYYSAKAGAAMNAAQYPAARPFLSTDSHAWSGQRHNS